MKRILTLTATCSFIFLQVSFLPKAKKVNTANGMAVVAYYSGNSKAINNFEVGKLTHIIFSFCHLKGNRLNVDDAEDSATIRKLVSLKKDYPSLKILLSLGGWGGCEYCSPVFATENGRQEFARSVKELNDYFQTDGIDLDWEYPAIEGYPGHQYQRVDRNNFTALVKAIRDQVGPSSLISFAAGGFNEYLKKAIEWKEVMEIVDFVNLMSYDLVNGFSLTTGHHTPLYSTYAQEESVDNGVRYMLSQGVPSTKIVIGAAFYARAWERVANTNNGLYQAGKFKSFIPYRQFDTRVSADSGFIFYRDSVAKAPYAYNPSKRLFATFDDEVSIRQKTEYVKQKGLGGIMFWELTLDRYDNGLLDVIDRTKNAR